MKNIVFLPSRGKGRYMRCAVEGVAIGEGADGAGGDFVGLVAEVAEGLSWLGYISWRWCCLVFLL